MTIEEARVLKQNMHVCFATPSGIEVMKFLEKIGGWIPTVYDSGETNEIIARDANRRLIGTIKTILECTPEQITAMATKEG